ncbi:MAG: hypothetical protein KDA92_25070, partial [Planctomycetales bacterium]|nr:hypothetical protein [Planctomycetales bacterium]
LVMSGAEVSCYYRLGDCRPPPESPSRTASFKTVERQLREGEQQRTSKLSAIGLAPCGELIRDCGWRPSANEFVPAPFGELKRPANLPAMEAKNWGMD